MAPQQELASQHELADQEEPAHRPQQALAAALERVGDRWSLLVVDALLGGPRRYGDLQEGLPGIATNLLADRLRHLEQAAERPRGRECASQLRK